MSYSLHAGADSGGLLREAEDPLAAGAREAREGELRDLERHGQEELVTLLGKFPPKRYFLRGPKLDFCAGNPRTEGQSRGFSLPWPHPKFRF